MLTTKPATHLPDETRYNFYAAIHKAIRLGHCRMISALGAQDFSDGPSTDRLMAELRGLLALGKGHLDGENREIHAALEQRASGASSHAAADHDDHEQSFAEIESLIRAVEVSAIANRNRAGHALYHRYALFAAHDIEHMNEEETELLAALHQHFSDAELHEIEGRIVSAIPPEKMAAVMGLMMPALNHGERVDMLKKLQSALPDPAFKGMLTGIVKPALPANDYAAAVGELMLRAA